MKAFKKDGSLTKRGIEAVEIIKRQPNTTINFQSWTGSGRHIRLVSHEEEILDLIKKFRYKYKRGNNSPRGGKDGEFISISKTAYKKITSILM